MFSTWVSSYAPFIAFLFFFNVTDNQLAHLVTLLVAERFASLRYSVSVSMLFFESNLPGPILTHPSCALGRLHDYFLLVSVT